MLFEIMMLIEERNFLLVSAERQDGRLNDCEGLLLEVLEDNLTELGYPID